MLFFSFSASFKNSNPREKVTKLYSSLFVSIIVAKYNIFPALTMAAHAKNKTFLAKQFAHAISGHYRDFEHAYVYSTIILRNRTEYRLILSRRGRRPSRLKSDDIPRD